MHSFFFSVLHGVDDVDHDDHDDDDNVADEDGHENNSCSEDQSLDST